MLINAQLSGFDVAKLHPVEVQGPLTDRMNAVSYILPCNTTKDELYKAAKDTIDTVLLCVGNDLIKQHTQLYDTERSIET